MIKVVICGDHPVVREGMKVAFSQTPDIRAVAEASTGGLSCWRTPAPRASAP